MCNVRNSSKSFRSFLLLFQWFFVAVFISACGGGGGDSDEPASIDISGSAIKGPVANGTVTAHVAEADGARGAALRAGTTDANGAYGLSLDPASANAVLLVLTGGSYMDEASSNMIALAAGETMEAYTRMPSSGGITVNITALTSLATGMVRNHIANGETLAAAINNAQAKVANIFEVGNVLYTLPPAPADLAGATQQEINYTLILAGLSQLDFNDATRSVFDILAEIIADLEADGVWGNGSAAYGPDDLLAAIAQFLANNPGITATVSPTVVANLSVTELDITLASDNTAPTITGTPATTVAENTAFSFTPTASDADGDTLLFSMANNPAWLTIDSSTGAVSGTPTNADVGSITGIVITVDDQQGAPNSTASLAPFDLTVTNTNDAPIISGTPPTTVAQGTLYTFAPTASDIDGDTLLFSITNNPAWLGIDSGTGVVSGTPAGADVGTSTGIVITADDQQGEANSTASLAPFDLTVTSVAPANVAPTISGTPQTRVGAVDDASTAVLTGGMTSTYSFTPTANDANGDTLTFSIINQPAWASFDTATGALTGTPTATDAGTTTSGVVISVSDGTDSTDLAAFDVSVLAGFNEALYADPSVSLVSTARRQYEANDGSLVSGNGWTSGGTPNPDWIQFDFDGTKTLYKVTLVDLPDLGTQFLTGVIEFSDGSTIPVNTALPNDGTPLEFVFDPIETTSVRITVTGSTANAVLTEVMTYSALDPGQTELASDLFNDGDSAGWTLVDSCEQGTSAWNPNYKFFANVDYQPSLRQTGDCRGFTVDGVEDGTKQLLGTAHTDADLRLMLRSDTDTSSWVNGVMGVLFAYQDTDNYYRFDTNERNGYRKLWKKVGGNFTELATSPQSYTPGTRPTDYSQSAWVNLRVVLRNGVIIVYMDGEKVLTAEDSSLTNGQIALLCARNTNCTFDNVVLLEGPSDPILGLKVADNGPGHVSGEYFVSTDSTLDIAAAVTESAGFDAVEFVLDEGLGGEISVTDATAPYANSFTVLPAGDHTVTAYLLDGASVRLTELRARDTMPKVAAGGIHLAAMGDSITAGTNDDVLADDISDDGRNTGGGYPPLLNNLLTAGNLQSVTVVNNGNPGETSGEAADRIPLVLTSTPEAAGYLLLYGANDSSGGSPVPSGFGLDCTDITAFTGCDGGYLGSFKHNIQRMINAIQAQSKQVYLSKPLPHGSVPARSVLQAEYGDAIQELVDDVRNNLTTYTPPDFHAFYTANPGFMADDQHPDGAGYQEMANLWCTALNGQNGMVCP